MLISDKIANEILEQLEEKYNIKVPNKHYLSVESLISTLIQNELNKWLNYDVDLNTFPDHIKFEGDE